MSLIMYLYVDNLLQYNNDLVIYVTINHVCYNIKYINMYQVSENKKPLKSDNDNKKKTLKIVLIISSIVLVIILALLIVLLWFNNNKPNTSNKVKYNNSYDASLLTDTSSLKNKSFTINGTTNDDKYVVSVIMNTTTSNASIGSYTEHDYLYSIYDGIPNNELILTLKVKEDNSDISDKISDITFTIYLGDKDSYNPITLDMANENNKSSIYTSNEDISIYRIDVEWCVSLS